MLVYFIEINNGVLPYTTAAMYFRYMEFSELRSSMALKVSGLESRDCLIADPADRFYVWAVWLPLTYKYGFR